jgi:hypothetical protein
MPNEKERIPVASAETGTLVECFIALRDRRQRRKALFTDEDAGDKEKQDAIGGILLHRFQDAGIESARCPSGTAYKASVVSLSVAERDTFFDWALQNDALAMIDVHANKPAVEAFCEQHNSVPPGLKRTAMNVIRVRRT